MWFSVYLLWLQHFDEKKRKNTNQYGFSFSLTWPYFLDRTFGRSLFLKTFLKQNKQNKKK